MSRMISHRRHFGFGFDFDFDFILATTNLPTRRVV
jgi:hypothetical protein